VPSQAFYYSNFAVAGTIGNSGGISSSATSMYLTSTPTGYPGSFPFKLVLDAGTASEEIVTVTAGAGTSGTPWTITRAQDGSTSHAHANGAAVQHQITAGDETLARVHEAETTYASGPPHGLPASAWQAAAVTALDEVTISGSTTASVNWTSISGSYNHLLIVVQGKFTETTLQSDDLLVTLNGSTASVYSYVEQFVTNVSGSSTGALFSGTNTGYALAGWPLLRLAASESGAAANAGGGSALIPNYTSAVFNKCFTSQSGAGDGSSAFVDMRTRSGWFNPATQAAVTQVTLTAPGSLYFASGTFLGLYGLS
jgi:hypothetical protein